MYCLRLAGLKRQIFTTLEWMLLPLCNALVAVSSSEYQELRAALGPDPRIMRINNSIPRDLITANECSQDAGPFEELAIPPGTKVILSTARFDTQKDVPTLIRAASILGRNRSDFVVVLAGDSEQRPQIEALAGTEGMRVMDVSVIYVNWNAEDEILASVRTVRDKIRAFLTKSSSWTMPRARGRRPWRAIRQSGSFTDSRPRPTETGNTCNTAVLDWVVFSIVMPTYNRAAILQRALTAMLAMDGIDGCELIVVGDGSTDATPEVLERITRQAPGLVRVVHQKNAGPGVARNTALALARRERILFLDDGVFPEPDLLWAHACFLDQGFDLSLGLLRWHPELADSWLMRHMDAHGM
jgi:hypothetical protein